MSDNAISRLPTPIPETVSEEALARAANRPLPIIGATAQLLLMCARESATADQADHIRQLCAAIEDWSKLIQQAEFRLIVPLVYRHLSAISGDVVPSSVISELKTRTLRAICNNLAMVAVHHRLVRDVLGPLNVPHLFFKGPSLAYRYYREPGARQFRDIDLLIPRQYMLLVGQRLREAGFRAHKDSAWGTDDGIRFLQRFAGMMDWISPEGVLVEMPCSLDGDWNRLPTDELIEQAESVEIAGLTVPVVSEADFFCYMCKHHGRHHWARLNWIADLNVILSCPGFDLQAALDRSKQRGVSRIVDAALEIHRAVATPAPWSYPFSDPFAHELFRHCLINLEGDFEQELALRDSFPTTSIDIPRQRRKWRFHVKRNLKRFRPDGQDYMMLPLSPRLLWLYYLLRPFLYLKRQLG